MENQTLQERIKANLSKAMIIKADGTEVEVTPENGRNFTLKEMQTAVGGYIERAIADEDLEMWVNEEGRLQPDRKVNAKATVIYTGGRLSLEDAVLTSPDHGATIIGDVLIGHPNLFRDPDELGEDDDRDDSGDLFGDEDIHR